MFFCLHISHSFLKLDDCLPTVVTCILVFVLQGNSHIVRDFASNKRQVEFASISSIQDLCKSKLYPTTGRLVKGNSNMVCKKFEDTEKRLVQTHCAYEY